MSVILETTSPNSQEKTLNLSRNRIGREQRSRFPETSRNNYSNNLKLSEYLFELELYAVSDPRGGGGGGGARVAGGRGGGYSL